MMNAMMSQGKTMENQSRRHHLIRARNTNTKADDGLDHGLVALTSEA